MKNLITQSSIVKCLLALMISFLTFGNSYSQYQERSYNLKCGAVSSNDYGRSIINRLDSGYAIAGFSYASGCGIGPFDWMFMKLKPSGFLQFSRLIGTQADDKCYSLVQSRTDSGYVLAGNMYDASRNRATLVKLDKSGTLAFSKRLDDSLNSRYSQVVTDFNNNWALTGWDERKVGQGISNKILVTQYNSFGIENWGYRYDSYVNNAKLSRSNDEAYSICYQPIGNSYCVAARTNFYSQTPGVWDILLVKLSITGAVIWQKVYRFNLPQMNFKPSTEPRKIIPMPDGGFAVVGFTNAYAQNGSDIIVLRVSSGGLLFWSFCYGGTAFLEYGNSMVLDGGTLVVTGERKNAAGASNALLMKISNAGGPPIWTKVWDATTPDPESGHDLVNSNIGAPNGYAVTGDTYRGADLFNPFLWRTNQNGVLPVTQCQDSTILNYLPNPIRLDSFRLHRVYVYDDKMSPKVSNPLNETRTICLSPVPDQTEPEIELDNIDEEIGFDLKQNYPNPFNPVTNIKFEIPAESFVTIKVYDIAGKEVYELVNEKKAKGRYEVRFDGSRLSSGVYYYKITAGNYNDIRKMMLIK